MNEEKVKEFSERLYVSCCAAPCDNCPLFEEECGGADRKDPALGEIQEKLGELWAEAHGFTKKEEFPKINEEFLEKMARYMDSTATKTDLKLKGISVEDWMSEPGNKEDWKNWFKENHFVDGNEMVEESEEKMVEFDTEPNFVLNVNENFIDDIYRFLDVNIHSKNAYWTPNSAWFSFSDGEEGFKKWFLFNLLGNITVTLEEKNTDDSGELDPTLLEVMAMFGIDESFTIGKAIECISRKDIESAKKYEAQLNDQTESTPLMVDVLRGWNLSCKESLFFLDFFKDNSRRELGDFDEIEALRYIAEKGALMEDQNVSNDDNG